MGASGSLYAWRRRVSSTSFKLIRHASTAGPVTLGCFAGHVPTITSERMFGELHSQTKELSWSRD
jgi:hypothetical protein